MHIQKKYNIYIGGGSMAENAINMSFRIDKSVKKQADELFKNLGLNTSVALNMFLTQCIREQGLPFIPTMEVPNKRLIKALKEVETFESNIKNCKKYNCLDEIIDDLDD